MIRRILLVPLLLLLLVLSGACKRDTKRVIGVVPKGSAHLFWQSVHAGANKAAGEHGVEIAWNAPATEMDMNAQIQIIDAMINRRVDAIALAPIDKKAMASVVERAGRERIPVVIFDSGIDTDQFLAQVATDNFHAGEIAAERIGKILGGKGKVAIVAVQVGAASTMAREDGFEKKIKADYPGIEIVAKQYGMADFAKSLAVAENILTANPDLDAMFASNESSTVGAAQALKGRKGTQVKLVGFDSSPKLIEELESGLIDSLVVQDPFKMGYESVKTAVASLEGKKVQKMQNLAPKLVDKANLKTAEIQAQLNPDLKRYLR